MMIKAARVLPTLSWSKHNWILSILDICLFGLVVCLVYCFIYLYPGLSKMDIQTLS